MRPSNYTFGQSGMPERIDTSQPRLPAKPEIATFGKSRLILILFASWFCRNRYASILSRMGRPYLEDTNDFHDKRTDIPVRCSTATLADDAMGKIWIHVDLE